MMSIHPESTRTRLDLPQVLFGASELSLLVVWQRLRDHRLEVVVVLVDVRLVCAS